MPNFSKESSSSLQKKSGGSTILDFLYGGGSKTNQWREDNLVFRCLVTDLHGHFFLFFISSYQASLFQLSFSYIRYGNCDVLWSYLQFWMRIILRSWYKHCQRITPVIILGCEWITKLHFSKLRVTYLCVCVCENGWYILWRNQKKIFMRQINFFFKRGIYNFWERQIIKNF